MRSAAKHVFGSRASDGKAMTGEPQKQAAGVVLH